MTKIAVAGMPAAGHLNPSLPLVRELVRRGIDVTYYTGPEFGDAVRETGARHRAYPEGTISAADIASATQSGSPVQVVARILTACERLVPFLGEEFGEERPDAVLHDSNALWGRVTAAGLGLPRISFMTTMLIGGSAYKEMKAREWLAGIRPMFSGVLPVVRARQRVRRTFGRDVFPPSPMFPMFGDLTLFPIPREMQRPDPRLDDSCHFVGPTVDVDAPGKDLDAELAAHLDGDDPVVLISLGTLHAGTDEFFRTCLTALADLPARIVLAVGRSVDPGRLGQPPANTLVRTSVPQLGLLRRTSVFVTHGGMNSALEALCFGVPLVVVPQQVEQLVIGLTVAELGAAAVLREHLSQRAVPGAALRTAVEHALTTPAVRERAADLRTSFRSAGGAPAAATLVEQFLGTTQN